MLFKEDLSVNGLESDNRVLRRANKKAEEYYNKDYEIYEVLGDLAHLMESRYERVGEVEFRAADLEELFIETKSIMNMNHNELIRKCKSMRIDSEGTSEDLKTTIVDKLEKDFNY